VIQTTKGTSDINTSASIQVPTTSILVCSKVPYSNFGSISIVLSSAGNGATISDLNSDSTKGGGFVGRALDLGCLEGFGQLVPEPPFQWCGFPVLISYHSKT
jgi:hypothetical protein